MIESIFFSCKYWLVLNITYDQHDFKIPLFSTPGLVLFFYFGVGVSTKYWQLVKKPLSSELRDRITVL